MTDEEWRGQWTATLVDNGIDKREAEKAFSVFYGNQSIDASIDPKSDAMKLIAVSTLPSDYQKD
jgi:hypothetical protein